MILLDYIYKYVRTIHYHFQHILYKSEDKRICLLQTHFMKIINNLIQNSLICFKVSQNRTYYEYRTLNKLQVSDFYRKQLIENFSSFIKTKIKCFQIIIIQWLPFSHLRLLLLFPPIAQLT